MGSRLETTNDVEGQRIGLEDADFGLESEVVVEGVADLGGGAIGGGVVEPEGAVRVLLNFDDGGGTVARRGTYPVEKAGTTTEGEGAEDPGAAADEGR